MHNWLLIVSIYAFMTFSVKLDENGVPNLSLMVYFDAILDIKDGCLRPPLTSSVSPLSPLWTPSDSFDNRMK